MSAHLYWGIRINAIGDATWQCLIAELIMRNSIGDSLCTGGTAYATQTDPDATPGMAFSSVPPNLSPVNLQWGTFWITLSPFVAPQTLYYQFAAPVDVASYEIYTSDWFSERPRDWEFVYSDDGVSWTTVQTQTGYQFTNGGLDNDGIGTDVMGYASFSLVIVPLKHNLLGKISADITVESGLQKIRADISVSDFSVQKIRADINLVRFETQKVRADITVLPPAQSVVINVAEGERI